MAEPFAGRDVRDVSVSGLPPAPWHTESEANGMGNGQPSDEMPNASPPPIRDGADSTSGSVSGLPATSSETVEDLAVRVAVRSRPLVTSERLEGARECLSYPANNANAVCLGESRVFKFDEAFKPESTQTEVYDKLVAPLVKACFNGYNATVLAYGQTGSGKTYTMGSGNCDAALDAETGVIPRVIRDVFAGVHERQDESTVTVRCVFLEVHNEEVRDLLHPDTKSKVIQIRENADGAIVVSGIREEVVASYAQMLRLLDLGCVSRTTGGTSMNSESSRSHAIFTVIVEQTHVTETAIAKHKGTYSCSKFHLVDLAGSERNKRTKATGARFTESININSGLLALGNVISALSGDDANRNAGGGKKHEGKRSAHVPYRDSKLTRLLQDSLGGNARTCVVACVSPHDSNIEETLNTLKYAQRARNIKNKPKVNRDPKDARLAAYTKRADCTEGELKFSHLGRIAARDFGPCEFCASNGGATGPSLLNTGYDQDKTNVESLNRQVSTLTDELTETKSLLTEARDDLRRDETIFTEKMREIKALKKERRERLKERPAGGALPPVPLLESAGGFVPVSSQSPLSASATKNVTSSVGDENEAPLVTPRSSLALSSPSMTPISESQSNQGTGTQETYTAFEVGKIHQERLLLKQQAVSRARVYQLEKKNLERRLRELSKNIASKERLIADLTENERTAVLVTQRYEDRVLALEQEKLAKEHEALRLRKELKSFETSEKSTSTKTKLLAVQNELAVLRLERLKSDAARTDKESLLNDESGKTHELQGEVREMRAQQEALRRGLQQRELEHTHAENENLDQIERLKKITDRQTRRIDSLTTSEGKIRESLLRKTSELSLAKKRISELEGGGFFGHDNGHGAPDDSPLAASQSPRVSSTNANGGSGRPMSTRDRALLYGDQVRSKLSVRGSAASFAGSASSEPQNSQQQLPKVDQNAMRALVHLETTKALQKRVAMDARSRLSAKRAHVLAERNAVWEQVQVLAVRKRQLEGTSGWTQNDHLEFAQLDDRVDGLDAELEFVSAKVNEAGLEDEGDESQGNSQEGVHRQGKAIKSCEQNSFVSLINSMRPEQAVAAAAQAMEAVVTVGLASKRLAAAKRSLEAQLADAQRAIEEMEQTSRMREMEYDRRVTMIRLEHGRRETSLMRLGELGVRERVSRSSNGASECDTDGDGETWSENDAGDERDAKLFAPRLPDAPAKLPATPPLGRNAKPPGVSAYPGMGATAAGRRDAGAIRMGG